MGGDISEQVWKYNGWLTCSNRAMWRELALVSKQATGPIEIWSYENVAKKEVKMTCKEILDVEKYRHCYITLSDIGKVDEKLPKTRKLVKSESSYNRAFTIRWVLPVWSWRQGN